MKKRNAPRFWADYNRVSTDDQHKGDFSSLDAQHLKNLAFIEAKIRESGSGQYVGSYREEGVSGTKTNRAEMNRLMDDVRAGKVTDVVATKISRFGRGKAFPVLEHLLTEAGATLHLSDQDFGDGLAGYINRSATNMMDGCQPLIIGDLVKGKQSVMVTQGYWCGAPHPFGTTTVIVDGMSDTPEKKAPRRLVADPETQPILLRAFEIAVTTGNITQVMRYLQRAAEDARRWNFTLVRHLLTNPVYRGVLVFGENRNEDAHDPIIPVELFDRVQERLKTGDSRPSRSVGYRVSQPIGDTIARKDGLFYPMRGHVRCVACGRMMTPKTSHGRSGPVPYYECTVSAKSEGPCPICRVNAHSLLTVLIAEVERSGQHPTRLDGYLRATAKAFPSPIRYRKDADALRAEEKKLDRELERLGRAVAIGGTLTTLVAEMRRLEAERSQVAVRRIKAEEMAGRSDAARPDASFMAACFHNFSLFWAEMDLEERGRVLPRVVEEVRMIAKGQGEVSLKLDAFATLSPSLVRNLDVERLPNASQLRTTAPVNTLFFPPVCRVPLTVHSGGKLVARPLPYFKERQP